VTRLFVYGTLVPGEVAAAVLDVWTIGDPELDAARGVLYDTGRGYPAATFSDDAATLVHGAVVALDPARLTTALETLDRYEGREYRRLTIRTAKGRDAHAYGWIGPLDGCVPVRTGRWRAP
jgi:gamma-glutamylcyclotransferase (GGCT)/AIG2-like uncharacterized protein YtfP